MHSQQLAIHLINAMLPW